MYILLLDSTSEMVMCPTNGAIHSFERKTAVSVELYRMRFIWILNSNMQYYVAKAKRILYLPVI